MKLHKVKHLSYVALFYAGDAIASIEGCTGRNCLPRANDSKVPKVPLENAATNVVNILTIVAAAVAVLFIVIGGIKYITSSGDSSKAASGKNTILYAVIGLALAILARAIVGFILGNTPN